MAVVGAESVAALHEPDLLWGELQQRLGLWQDVRLTRHRPRHQAKTDPEAVDALVSLGTLRVRFCVVDIGGEEPEFIATNLAEAVLPHQEPEGGYWLRWPNIPMSEYSAIYRL